MPLGLPPQPPDVRSQEGCSLGSGGSPGNVPHHTSPLRALQTSRFVDWERLLFRTTRLTHQLEGPASWTPPL